MTTIETVLFSARRLRHSVNGNPRFVLATGVGEMQTQSDSACGYDVENLVAKAGVDGLPVLIVRSRAGRVWAIEDRS